MPNQVPLEQADHPVDMGTIFWNGGKAINKGTPDDPNPFADEKIDAPDVTGAEKTITFTNYGTTTIYPFLRTENQGKDPNASPAVKQYYDPQDYHGQEFREYVGYSEVVDGKTNYYLGLPKGASITVEVPLVLWDGDNVTIATDDKNLTTAPGAVGGVFNYESSAKVSIVGTEQTNNAVWLKSSTGYPTGDVPFVMFYHADKSHTVTDDAPAQLAELTFRDTYLKHFINDSKQTFGAHELRRFQREQTPGPRGHGGQQRPDHCGSHCVEQSYILSPDRSFRLAWCEQDCGPVGSADSGLRQQQQPERRLSRNVFRRERLAGVL